MTTETTEETPFGEWCIVEQMGHRRLAGYVREVQIAGEGFLRLDIPAADSDPGRTQYLRPGTIFTLHPVTEPTARAAAAQWRPAPVSRWELPLLGAIEPPAAPADDHDRHVDADHFDDADQPPNGGGF